VTARPLPLLLALLIGLMLGAIAFAFVQVRTDLADFIPRGGSPAARLVLGQARVGTAATIILAAIEGAPPAELARISETFGAALRRTGLFEIVENGAELPDDADIDRLFRYRYLLAPSPPGAFEVPALRAGMQGVLTGLAGSAAPLVKRFGLADPTGAFARLTESWLGESHVRVQDGVWFSDDGTRALLLLRTRAGAMDSAGQDRVAAATEAAFRAADPRGARLLMAGPPVFARAAATAIRADVEFVSIASTLAIVALLLWRFRSAWVIAAIGATVIPGIAAAAIAVQLAFGFVHGITLGFGITMLGVTVDYPVLLIGHRKQREAAQGTLQRIGKTLTLAVAAAAIGLTGMVFSGFPGLSQLGLFAVVGVLTAAAVTRFVLPPLIVAAGLAPVTAGAPAWLLRAETVRARRAWGLLPVGAAALFLLLRGGPAWESDLARLSPVPPDALALEAQLRASLGAPDVGRLIVVQGADVEQVLRREEALMPALDALRARGAIAGAELAARFLPSIATQTARRDALPGRVTLEARVREAMAGLGFRDNAFETFVDDVDNARALPPLTLADMSNPLIATRVRALLIASDGATFGLVAPHGVTNPAALTQALAGAEGVQYVDVKAETDRLFARYTAQAWMWLGIGAAAIAVVVGVGLRDGRAMRVLATIAAAVLVTLACLTATGVRLSLFHLVALQLMIGVGLDYALFFARRRLDLEERARTLRTLITCNVMTLLTFGLLVSCRNPLLRGIGATVAIGVVAAIVFAFLFAGPRTDETPETVGTGTAGDWA
jgi:predicted exporter